VEATLMPILAPLLRPLVARVYKVNPGTSQRSIERIHGIVRHVEERLDTRKNFLVGGRFTAADPGFAALAAPVLLPPGCRAVQPNVASLPSAIRAEVQRLRERFALRLFREERG